MATTSNQVKINIDDQEIILTGEALAAFESDRAAEHARQVAEKNAFIAAVEAKENARISAIAKLKALGLTEAEASALLA